MMSLRHCFVISSVSSYQPRQHLTTELAQATRKGAKMIWAGFSWEAGYSMVRQIHDMNLPLVSTGYNSVAQDTGGF